MHFSERLVGEDDKDCSVSGKPQSRANTVDVPGLQRWLLDILHAQGGTISYLMQNSLGMSYAKSLIQASILLLVPFHWASVVLKCLLCSWSKAVGVAALLGAKKGK